MNKDALSKNVTHLQDNKDLKKLFEKYFKIKI